MIVHTDEGMRIAHPANVVIIPAAPCHALPLFREQGHADTPAQPQAEEGPTVELEPAG